MNNPSEPIFDRMMACFKEIFELKELLKDTSLCVSSKDNNIIYYLKFSKMTMEEYEKKLENNYNVEEIKL